MLTRRPKAAVAIVLVLATTLVFAAQGGAADRAARGGRWRIPSRPSWYWQLSGKLRTDVRAQLYDVDGFETSAAQVAALHARGIRVICYVDVGTAEKWRPDYRRFPRSVLGRPDAGWPGERWIDIRARAVEPIMRARFSMCARKGFDAVEADNIEAFSNPTGFQITAVEQLAYNRWVARAVHALGMDVLQKNDGVQSARQVRYFDGALSEECNQWRECAAFRPYLRAGKPVLDAEYRLPTARFCAADAVAGIMGARYDLALDGRRYEPCW